MYDRAAIWRQDSQNALTHVADDDVWLDLACYTAQQSLEFLLKAILLDYGIAYDKSHNIRYLLQLVDDTGFTFAKHDALDALADTVTDWEEKSRYGKGVRTMVQTVQRVHNIYDSINQAFLDMQEKNNQGK